MQLSGNFRGFIKRNGFLLISAAWMITLAIIIDSYWSPNSSLQSAHSRVQSYIKTAERDFNKLSGDTTLINSIVNGTYNEKLLLRLTEKNYFLFVYTYNESGELQLNFWNTQQALPSGGLLYLEGKAGFVQMQNGYYVWNNFNNGKVKLLALIPVKWNFIVTNEYLRNDFAINGINSNTYDISRTLSGGMEIKSISKAPLFSIVKKIETPVQRNNPVSVFLILMSAITILLLIQLFANYISKVTRAEFGVLFFLLTVVGLRVLSYFIPLPLNFRQFELFDPSVYGSNMVLRSLGDLLINAILFVWIVLFIRSQIQERIIAINKANTITRWMIFILVSVVIISATYAGSSVVRSLISDSQISFDVLNFFTLNIYSVTGFVILCCIAIGYYFLCQVILFVIKPLLRVHIISFYLCIACLGLLMLTFRIGYLTGGIEIYILLWLLAFVYLLNNTYLNLLASHIISSRLVFWLFLFSISIASLIIFENRIKELRNREHYAEILAAKVDPTSETLVNSMLTDFREDYLADNFHRLLSPYSNQVFKDSLVEGNFSGYTERYETRIYSYDSLENPIYNADSTKFHELNTILNTQAKPTGIPNLFFYDISFDRFSYISKKTLIAADGKLLGYVFIIASPRKSKDEALIPELFNRGRNNTIENSSTYAFAIYNNGKLISSHNDYPFATKIDPSKLPKKQFFETRIQKHNELWYNPGGGRLVVIVKENSLSIESITLFSYLFCSFLLMTFILWLLNVVFGSRFRLSRMRLSWQLSIRNQIHGTIIFICVISFLVIGIATILFFIDRYESTNREKLSRSIHIMENEVKNSMETGWELSDTIRMFNNESRNRIEIALKMISEVHGTDVNLYDLHGNLQVSSLALPYIKGIVSTKMNPRAYFHLHHNSEVQYFQKEKIGDLSYESNYKPIIDKQGDKYAYLNIPYFTSQSRLKEEISNFLVTIINLNAFIFLIAGIVALFITNRITRSFSLISDKMKKINLGKRNEAISWDRGDEIGELVHEFNKMVGKLDESAQVLAKTEREGAWREMAKQIAHEIKNPLTPMKLSMQYLQKAIAANAPNVKELTINVANTLVEQIDHLSQIAGEFSQFANIENSKKEIVNLNEVLNNVVHLFSNHEEVEFRVFLLRENVFVEADKTHINRVFTNLIQNALQSVEAGNPAVVVITESISGNKVKISIRDNGQGISDEVKEHIFTPNFTTKSSGTGLGLAMCKRMIENAHGEIWFESFPGDGTTFFIELPLTS